MKEKEAKKKAKEPENEETSDLELSDPADPGKVNMYWIYFGDIIAAILEQPHIKKQPQK